MFTKIQEAENSTEENLLMVIQDVTKEMQKQVDAAQRLVDVQKGKVSKETVNLAILRKEAGFSKNTIFTEKQMLKLKQEQQSALEKYIETLTKRKNKET